MEKSIFRIYKPEELKKMNYILGKEDSNLIFTTFELQALNLLDLEDEKIVDIAHKVWKYRFDNEAIDELISLIDGDVKRIINTLGEKNE